MENRGKAAILDRPKGKFTIEDAPLPDVREGELLVKQEMCGVCGTDAHIYQGHLPEIVYPIVLGHEVVGRIAKLGKGVESDFTGELVKEGDRIYVIPGISCRKCYFCAVLREPTLCLNGRGLGFRPFPEQIPHFQGGYSEYIYVNHPNWNFIKMHVEPEVAVLLEPFTIGIHMVDRARIKAGDVAVIQGAGAIGLLTLVAARETGAYRTIVIGAPESRLELAREFGSDMTINIEEIKDPKERVDIVRDETTGKHGADIVFECTGVPQAVPEGIDMLRRGGTYVVAGHFTDAGDVRLNPFSHFTRKHITVIGVWGSDVTHFVRGRPILESGKYPFEKLVSHKLPLERVADAMKTITEGYRLDGREVRKIVITSSAP